MCVPKSNSNDRYAITCDAIAYHLVHYLFIRLINKCQSGIDFIFTSKRNILQFYDNIGAQSSISWKNTDERESLQSIHARIMRWSTKGDEICFRYNKIGYFDTLEKQTMGVYKYASTFPMASRNKKRCYHRKKTRRKKM